jgi:Alpha/beta hydrolase domain containing 18
VIARAFHTWERRLAATAARNVRPFEWGLDWLDGAPARGVNATKTWLASWGPQTVAGSDAFYAVAPADDYELSNGTLTFSSAIRTPHRENNRVVARYFPAHSARGRRRAVLVLPQWNSDAQGHIGLCRLLNRFGITALRLSLPYHDVRMPPELTRADYIVSANVGRTAQVCRQAVLDARRAIAWLHREGYESIGILGTSLGSCLAMLTTAHEPLIRSAALNHISPYFADVVWDGLSTAHVRETLEGNVTLDELRQMWLPISPLPYLERVRGRAVFLVYALYDLTFPVHLSRMLVSEFRRHHIDHRLLVLPCGHYSTGVMPFKWMDGIALCRFLSRTL